MKSVEEVVACVCDAGTFIDVATKLAETMAQVYYWSPWENEYLSVRDCIKGSGLERVQRLDEPLDPSVLDTIDLFVFPDTNFSGLQRHLRGLGKAVWGANGATDLELYRTYFLDVLEEVGLPMVHNERITGLSALAAYLKDNTNKWVKVNRFRSNMETWHHLDWQHSQRTLENLAVIFGGAKDQIVFVVQDDIQSDMEVGYDGWCIDGQFPSMSFQGYEKKNELYLGSVLSDRELPDDIQVVNRAMAGILGEYGYRCWWATEIRIAEGVPYFIDPTPRMPGQTGEHQLETIANFADIIWQGANGVVVEPEFNWKFAAEATLHYENNTKDPAIVDEWKTLDIPEEARRWLKLYHYCVIDGLYNFTSKNTDEVGVVLGVGDSVEESIEHLTENLELLKDLPVRAEVNGFTSLLESIEEAEKAGLPFGGRIPKPEKMLKVLEKAA